MGPSGSVVLFPAAPCWGKWIRHYSHFRLLHQSSSTQRKQKEQKRTFSCLIALLYAVKSTRVCEYSQSFELLSKKMYLKNNMSLIPCFLWTNTSKYFFLFPCWNKRGSGGNCWSQCPVKDVTWREWVTALIQISSFQLNHQNAGIVCLLMFKCHRATGEVLQPTDTVFEISFNCSNLSLHDHVWLLTAFIPKIQFLGKFSYSEVWFVYVVKLSG